MMSQEPHLFHWHIRDV